MSKQPTLSTGAASDAAAVAAAASASASAAMAMAAPRLSMGSSPRSVGGGGVLIGESSSLETRRLEHETANQQAQRMENSIQQDLTRAMAGLRQQFRQSFESTRAGESIAGLAALAAAEPQEPQRTTAAHPPPVNAAAPPVVETEAEAAARDEMLDGLAKLRRELEAQRVQQSSQLMESVNSDKQRHTLQVSAAEAAITDVRRDLDGQKASLTDLRRELAMHQDFCQKRTGALEAALTKVCDDLVQLRQESAAQQNLVQAEDLNQSVQQLNASSARIEASFRSELNAMSALMKDIQAPQASFRSELNTMSALMKDMQAPQAALRDEVATLRVLAEAPPPPAADAALRDEVAALRVLAEAAAQRERVEDLQADVRALAEQIGRDTKLAARIEDVERTTRALSTSHGAVERMEADIHAVTKAIEAERQLRAEELSTLQGKVEARGCSDDIQVAQTEKAGPVSEDAKVAVVEQDLAELRTQLGTQLSEVIQNARSAAEEGAAVGAAGALPEALASLRASLADESRSHLSAARETLQREAVACCTELRNELCQRMRALEVEFRLAAGQPQPALPSTAASTCSSEFDGFSQDLSAPSGLGASMAARVAAAEAEARKSVAAMGQLGEVLRLTQSITAGSDRVMEHISREASSRKAAEDRLAERLTELDRRVFNVETQSVALANAAGLVVSRELAVKAATREAETTEAPTVDDLRPRPQEVPGSSPVASARPQVVEASPQDQLQQNLLSEDLKKSLENLVDKVNKTLCLPSSSPPAPHGAPATAQTLGVPMPMSKGAVSPRSSSSRSQLIATDYSRTAMDHSRRSASPSMPRRAPPSNLDTSGSNVPRAWGSFQPEVNVGSVDMPQFRGGSVDMPQFRGGRGGTSPERMYSVGASESSAACGGSSHRQPSQQRLQGVEAMAVPPFGAAPVLRAAADGEAGRVSTPHVPRQMGWSPSASMNNTINSSNNSMNNTNGSLHNMGSEKTGSIHGGSCSVRPALRPSQSPLIGSGGSPTLHARPVQSTPAQRPNAQQVLQAARPSGGSTARYAERPSLPASFNQHRGQYASQAIGGSAAARGASNASGRSVGPGHL